MLQSSEYIAVVSIQSACYSVIVTNWLWNTTILMWVACKGGGWPSHVIFPQTSSGSILLVMITLITFACGLWNVPMQPRKYTFTVLIVEYCVQCLVVGFFTHFLLKNNPELFLDIVREFLGHLTDEEIAESWFQQDETTFHTVQATICCSEIEYFGKDCCSNFRRICHCHKLNKMLAAVTHGIWTSWNSTYATSLSTYHRWCCYHCQRTLFVLLSYVCNTLMCNVRTFVSRYIVNTSLWIMFSFKKNPHTSLTSLTQMASDLSNTWQYWHS
jgi:hypothetical protein